MMDSINEAPDGTFEGSI